MAETSAPEKHLVITGGSKGIGLATAKQFQSAGYRVINLSRSSIPLPGAVHIDADLTAKDWLEAAKQPLLEAIAGSAGITLVHNCALQIPGNLAAVTEPDLRATVEVNIVAPVLLTTLLLEHMPPGSSILYVGSTLSLRAAPNLTTYVTTKHAQVGLMKSTCQDLAGTGIHTACICPGFTDTEMLARFAGEVLPHLASMTTQGRLIAPEEIANVIYFAAHNPVVNGAILPADLGMKEQ